MSRRKKQNSKKPRLNLDTYFMQITIVSICRELKDTKQRLESQSAEIRKKEGQLKEMQTKLEQGEGCKLLRARSNNQFTL